MNITIRLARSPFASLAVAAAVGALLATPASAQVSSSALSTAEASAFALTDQALNLFVGLVDRQGCAASSGSYEFEAKVRAAGDGTGKVDLLALAVAVASDGPRGARLLTADAGDGSLADRAVSAVSGEFTYSANHELVMSSSGFAIADAGGVVAGYTTRALGGLAGKGGGQEVADQAALVLALDGLPRARWQQVASFERGAGAASHYRAARARLPVGNALPCTVAAKRISLQTDARTGDVAAAGTIVVGEGAVAAVMPDNLDSAPRLVNFEQDIKSE